MNEIFGSTRSVISERYALLTPAGFVPSALPGWEKATCHVVISPALGATFCQLLVTLQQDGQCAGKTGGNQFFLYVLEGPASILLDDRRHRLEPGSFVYLPPGKDMQLNSGGPATRLLVLQKRYQPLTGASRPGAFVSHERDAKPLLLPVDEEVRSQALLPNDPGFDMAVSLFTFNPGAMMPTISTRVMEDGITILRGQGICRLNRDWYPVQVGDVIWTAPFCPQWFAAMGKTPAMLIRFQDVNRDPI